MKIETIEELRNTGIITLVECNESEKTNNNDVVKDTKKGKWYKIEETYEEIKLELLGKGVFLIIFSVILIICLVVFRWIFNRKINNNPIKSESIVTIVNSIILVLCMFGVVVSGWYTVLYYCN